MILVDAHVHIYSCFDLQIFFDVAFENFQEEAVRNGQGNGFAAVLLLADWSGQNWFQRLVHNCDDGCGTGSKAIGNWTFHRTDESGSLYLQRRDGKGLLLISGCKIITAENLEVLALATERVFEEGTSLEEAIQTIKENGAIPVIPWAAGKWMGRRGKILENLLESAKVSDFFLCDNRNRPVFWPSPYHFKLAEKRGIRVLSGSDPLNFASEACRVGSFGFSVQGPINHKQPIKDLRQILLDRTTTFELYGHLENPYWFFRNQLGIQILKRRRKKGLV